MNIFNFVKRLNKREIFLISNSLKRNCAIVSGKNNDDVSLFFEWIIKAPLECANDEYFLNESSKKYSQNAYDKLKSRLFIKILEVFSSDDFISDDEIINKEERVEIRIKKKLLQLKIIQLKESKHGIDANLRLIEEITESSKEYELYENMIEALIYKKHIVLYRKKFEEFEKINEEIEFYREAARIRNLAFDYFSKLSVKQELTDSIPEEKFLALAKEKIRILESSSILTISVKTQYYYWYIKFIVAQYCHNYSECMDIGLDILGLLKRNPSIYRNTRIGIITLNLANCLIYRKKLQQAAATARSARINFQHLSLNYFLSIEQEFFACFYLKDFSRCSELIGFLLNAPVQEIGQIRLDKYVYYSGILDFATGKVKEALRISNLNLEINKEKYRWDLGTRYLKIICQIELENYSEASDSIEALRKQLSRLENDQTKEQPSERDELIFLLLTELNSLKYESSSQSLSHLLKKLGNKDETWSWNFFTHEIIPINRWMSKFLLRKKINPAFTGRKIKNVKRDDNQKMMF